VIQQSASVIFQYLSHQFHFVTRLLSLDPDQNHAYGQLPLQKGSFAEVLVVGDQYSSFFVCQLQKVFITQCTVEVRNPFHIVSFGSQEIYDGLFYIHIRNNLRMRT